MKTTHRPLTVVALLLSLFMSAMEMTVVSTAMPTVVADLGGIRLYAWVFTAYMLTSTVTVPIYGKLADLLGRKPIMLFGLTVFLLGSVLSGFSTSMAMLITARAIQGLGAGAMQPIALTIIGDIFSLEERAKMQGLFGGVWGLAGIVGPVLGGVIVKYLGWRWIFFINVPFGLAAMGLLVSALHEKVEKRGHTLDVAGALLLTGAIVLLLTGTHGGGWAVPAFVGSALCVAGFVFVESRASEPMLPLDLFRNRSIAVASLAGALVGGSMLAMVTYVPLFVQGVLGGTATEAASAITPMVIGWPIASTISGRLLPRVGPRPLIRFGLTLSALAALALALLLHPGASLWVPRLGTALFGVGLGFANTALLIAVQSSVDWSRRGVATASTMFFRSIGGTIAVGALGALVVAALTKDPSVPADAANRLMQPHQGGLDVSLVETLHRALASGLGVAFWVIFGIALAAAITAFLFPRLHLGSRNQPVGGEVISEA